MHHFQHRENMKRIIIFGIINLICTSAVSAADESSNKDDSTTVEEDLGKSRDASGTDDDVVQREEEAGDIKELTIDQIKELRGKGQTFAFDADLQWLKNMYLRRSVYKALVIAQKKVFNELFKNVHDAIMKVRVLSLADATEELSLKIQVDNENGWIHFADTGIGMTKQQLVKNLGFVFSTGTREFKNTSNFHGFHGGSGFGFYSYFLPADLVVVVTKHNDDQQYVWQSESNVYSIVLDPRGNTLGRGTIISLHLREDLRLLLKEGINFITAEMEHFQFNVYIWTSKTESVEGHNEDNDHAKQGAEKHKTEKTFESSGYWKLIHEFETSRTQKQKLDVLTMAQIKELNETSEHHEFKINLLAFLQFSIRFVTKKIVDVFLRELISNASDALEKMRILSLNNSEVLGDMTEMSIKIKADPEKHMLYITDTGIGMTREELIKNLGTITESGTNHFIQDHFGIASASEAKDIIGNLCYRFYSCFRVAGMVAVTSKHNDDHQYIWISNTTDYSVIRDTRGNTLGRGTTISLHLKNDFFKKNSLKEDVSLDDQYDYLDETTLKRVIRRYSQLVKFNIYLWSRKYVDEGEPNKEMDKPKAKKVSKTVWHWELINKVKEIWKRKQDEISNAEYIEFYKSVFDEHEDPMTWIHYTVEGELNYTAILFVPSNRQPIQQFYDTFNLKIFLRRVQINTHHRIELPSYLAFIKWMIISDDLPALGAVLRTLPKVVIKKFIYNSLRMIKRLNKDEYKQFWKTYNTSIISDCSNEELNKIRFLKLLRFFSTYSDSEMTSLTQYVERMKENQNKIFFIPAHISEEEASRYPSYNILLKKGIEILNFDHSFEELQYCAGAFHEFAGNKFQNALEDDFSEDQWNEGKMTDEL